MLDKIREAVKAIEAAEKAGKFGRIQVRIEEGPVWFDISRSYDEKEFYFSGFYTPAKEEEDGAF